MRETTCGSTPNAARRRAKPRDVVQDAVDAIADTYRDRLAVILEQQDGPAWLDALNDRRRASMTRDGKGAAATVRVPRAARRPELSRLRSGRATADPRGRDHESQAAVGPRQRSASPQASVPRSREADGYRAWQLYTDITGHVPVGDPFDR